MKKSLSILCMVLLAVLFVTLAAAETGHKTAWDTFVNPKWNETLEIAAPALRQEGTAAEIAADETEMKNCIARAWYNLKVYETETAHKSEADSFAAEIYKGMKNGPAIAAFTAEDEEAVCINVLFAMCKSGKAHSGIEYWLEWNLETQRIRVVQVYGVEDYKRDEDFLNDYVFKSHLYATMGGNIIGVPTAEYSVGKYLTSSEGLTEAFDQISKGK